MIKKIFNIGGNILIFSLIIRLIIFVIFTIINGWHFEMNTHPIEKLIANITDFILHLAMIAFILMLVLTIQKVIKLEEEIVELFGILKSTIKLIKESNSMHHENIKKLFGLLDKITKYRNNGF